ncbi:hypothetical protein SCHPADRAFT_942138 [Schizopora paradoxa]|uniref:F-box domain-containing protein n=1 Tax=Schizopora paradoxa TaxID=27342 RepID=A0A0H2RHG6_9AGAM|nr:hypothetical protein SCHPADRAFT_942138 [Schizopora paradoxa]
MQTSDSKDEEKKPHRCDAGDLNPMAINVLMDTIDRIRQSATGGCLSAQTNWFQDRCVPLPSSHIYNPTQATQDRIEANRLHDLAESFLLTADALQSLRSLFIHQSMALEENAGALRLRAGLSSLPDEILINILECAAYSGGSDAFASLCTVQDAVKLSLVCRRFRDLAIRSSFFWCRISNNMNINLVSALCDRLSDPIGEVFLKESTNHDVRQFIRAVAASSQFWIRFTHGLDFLPSHSPLSREELVDVAKESYGLQAPFLSEISIHYPEDLLNAANKDQTHAHYYSTWITPRLTCFRISNLVPVPFASSAGLTSFTIRLDFLKCTRVPETITALVDFLVSCPNLTALALAFGCLVVPYNAPMRSRTELHRVEKLELHLSNCSVPEVTHVLNLLRFPHASSFGFRVSWYNWASIETPARSVHAILDDMSNFAPSVTELDLEVDFEHIANQTYPIIFPRLYGIRHFTLSTCDTELNVSIPKGAFLPSIRTLTFKNCESLDREWVSVLLNRLKEQGNLPDLTVSDCTWVNSDTEMSDVLEMKANSEASSNSGLSVVGDGLFESTTNVTVEDLLVLVKTADTSELNRDLQ